MKKNIYMLVGLPTVGKSSVISDFEKLKYAKKLIIKKEDQEYLSEIHKLNPQVPLFKTIEDFTLWKNEGNRDKVAFLYERDKEGKSKISNMFENMLDKYKKEAKENPDKTYLIDTGGFSYTRDMSIGNVIYLKFKSFEEFKKRFKERYRKGRFYQTFVPLENGELIRVEDSNIKYYYEFASSLYKDKANIEIESNENAVNVLLSFLKDREN